MCSGVVSKEKKVTEFIYTNIYENMHIYESIFPLFQN